MIQEEIYVCVYIYIYIHINSFHNGSAINNLLAMQPKEMQARSLGEENSLEEGMATHSSILAWRIP